MRENTRREYRRLLVNFALTYFDRAVRVRDLDRAEMQHFVDWLTAPPGRDGRLCDRSVANALTPLRRALDAAVAEGLLDANPAEQVVLPRRRAGRAWSMRERRYLTRRVPHSPSHVRIDADRVRAEPAAVAALDGPPGQRRLRGLPRPRPDEGRQPLRPPDPFVPPATPQGKINLADPDSRNVKTSRGWVRGYNAQAATNTKHIVIAAELTADSPDFGHLQPMVDAAQAELAAIGISETPSVVLADAGYWHQDQMENIINRGIQVLIPPDAGKRKGSRPGWDGGLYSFMRRVLETDRGGELYAKRQGMIEPVFGHTKFNRRYDRFQRRGRAACRSEWRLITATHNLVKLWRHNTTQAIA